MVALVAEVGGAHEHEAGHPQDEREERRHRQHVEQAARQRLGRRGGCSIASREATCSAENGRRPSSAATRPRSPGGTPSQISIGCSRAGVVGVERRRRGRPRRRRRTSRRRSGTGARPPPRGRSAPRTPSTVMFRMWSRPASAARSELATTGTGLAVGRLDGPEEAVRAAVEGVAQRPPCGTRGGRAGRCRGSPTCSSRSPARAPACRVPVAISGPRPSLPRATIVRPPSMPWWASAWASAKRSVTTSPTTRPPRVGRGQARGERRLPAGGVAEGDVVEAAGSLADGEHEADRAAMRRHCRARPRPPPAAGRRPAASAARAAAAPRRRPRWDTEAKSERQFRIAVIAPAGTPSTVAWTGSPGAGAVAAGAEHRRRQRVRGEAAVRAHRGDIERQPQRRALRHGEVERHLEGGLVVLALDERGAVGDREHAETDPRDQERGGQRRAPALAARARRARAARWAGRAGGSRPARRSSGPARRAVTIAPASATRPGKQGQQRVGAGGQRGRVGAAAGGRERDRARDGQGRQVEAAQRADPQVGAGRALAGDEHGRPGGPGHARWR